MDAFLAEVGEPVLDASQETFELFSQPLPSQDLGIVDPKAEVLHLSIGKQDFEIKQSPGVLQSSREGGTTGAAVWQTSIRLAEWLQSPQNCLFQLGALNDQSVAIELGSGISGIVPLVLASRMRRIVATDQPYLLKALRDNVANNRSPAVSKSRKFVSKMREGSRVEQTQVELLPLDWETDLISSFMQNHELDSGGVDLLIACDCIYNYALIEPFVAACADIAKVKSSSESRAENTYTLCVIAQQLRQPEVFEQWLEAFLRSFRVWRVPQSMTGEGFNAGSGFVVHVAVLRDDSGT